MEIGQNSERKKTGGNFAYWTSDIGVQQALMALGLLCEVRTGRTIFGPGTKKSNNGKT